MLNLLSAPYFSIVLLDHEMRLPGLVFNEGIDGARSVHDEEVNLTLGQQLAFVALPLLNHQFVAFARD
jgi:hypothetical protein